MILYLLRFDEHYYALRADEWYKKPGLGAPQLRLPTSIIIAIQSVMLFEEIEQIPRTFSPINCE